MNHRHTALLLSWLGTLCACNGGSGDSMPQNAGGNIRVVHVADARWQQDAAATEMTAALDRHADIALVFAHNDAMAYGAALACKQKQRTSIRIVGIGGSAEAQQRVADAVIDATFLHPTGAAAAIDMALLACSGIPPPRRLELGTRMFTKATLAAGGTIVPSPGDIVYEALKRQHASVLTTTPVTDVVFRIAMAHRTGGDPRQVRLGEELKTAAKRYPQIQFDYHPAEGTAEQQVKLVRDFIAQNYNAILVAPEDPVALRPVCKDAIAKEIKVIVLDRELGSDDCTCFVGCNEKAIGKAVGTAIGTLLPNGGAIVELQGAMTTSAAQQRHEGFVEALGPRKKS
ncbi:MAG TPA: substrate-binding domain-containing protein [Planctomycetota bacterium]|nr:substrate-binding domain-containing protein [Planctomycetota bacterium]